MQFGVLKMFLNCGILFNFALVPALIHFVNNLSRLFLNMYLRQTVLFKHFSKSIAVNCITCSKSFFY